MAAGGTRTSARPDLSGVQLPAITVESPEQCMRRVELELAEVDDQGKMTVANSSVITLQSDQQQPISDHAAST